MRPHRFSNYRRHCRSAKGQFLFTTEEEIVLRNWQRSTREYWEHLPGIVRRCINEDMGNDNWAVAMGWGGILRKEQPNVGEEKDNEDPLFAEKRNEFSLALRLAKHIRRPDSFRYHVIHRWMISRVREVPGLTPVNRRTISLMTEVPGVTTLTVDRMRPTDLQWSLLPLPLRPRHSAPVKAKKTKKAKSVAFEETILKGKPIWPVVASFVKLLTKKEMFLGRVSTKKSEKDFKGLLLTANGQIRQPENFIQHDVYPRYKELHGQLTEATNSGWEYIEKQDTAITLLYRQVATLEKDFLKCERATLEKDHENAQLQPQLDTANHITKNAKKQADFYIQKKQANGKKKPVISVEDQVKIEDAKRDNQIKIAEKKGMAKVRTQNKNKENDMYWQNQHFNVAKKNHRRNGNTGRQELGLKASHGRRRSSRYSRYSGNKSFGESDSSRSYSRGYSRSRSHSSGESRRGSGGRSHGRSKP